MNDPGIDWGLMAGTFGAMIGLVAIGVGWTLLVQLLLAWRFGLVGGNRRAVTLVNAVTGPAFSLGFVVLLFAAQQVSWR